MILGRPLKTDDGDGQKGEKEIEQGRIRCSCLPWSEESTRKEATHQSWDDPLAVAVAGAIASGSDRIFVSQECVQRLMDVMDPLGLLRLRLLHLLRVPCRVLGSKPPTWRSCCRCRCCCCRSCCRPACPSVSCPLRLQACPAGTLSLPTARSPVF